MELYIEKCFLDKFNKEWNANATSIGKTVLASILKTYGNVNWYIDYEIDSPEKLEQFNIEFSEISSHIFPPIPINSTIEEHFFEYSGCEQTIICAMHDEAWFDDAEKKGALCFSFNNFEKKIEEMVSICGELKIDLSEQFLGWEYFKQLKAIPKNRIFINDGYLFAQNSGNKPIDENVIPLLKNVISPNSEANVEIYTDYLNNAFIKIDSIKNKLNNVFKSDYKVTFSCIQGHFHDRILYSNFFMIGCGVGFNFNKNKKSNSIITVDFIFDKFTYNRMNNHLRLLKSKKENSIIK
jgi:hypothetical protein